ncbi:MAG: glycosyltransferase family 39 protein [Chloroflexi bacterium]|nr:glycosyltransferase family 39 protein [Chloroflexota bacterium]
MTERGPITWVRAHPDLVAMLLIVLVALTLRGAFAFRVPAFVTKDSIEYVEPALDLVDGEPFVLAQRRTPAYPLFMALAMSVFGRDLLGITLAQHLLGVGTAVVTYGIGRLAFGRAAGLIGGLLAALSSPLLIYEHYLITESVFTFCLTLAIFLFVAGLQSRRFAWFTLGGLALGMAALTRPVGQAILLVLPFAFVPVLRRWRPTLAAVALAVAGFALLVIPWTIRNQLVYGTASAASMGRFLMSRSVKHERNFVFYDKEIGAYSGEPPARTRARQIAQEVTDKRPEPGQVFQRIRDELGLTEAQTDAMMKDIALEAILRDPGLWVHGTLGMFVELLDGAPKEESVRWHLGVHDQPRVTNQWGRFAYLLDQTGPDDIRGLNEAERLGQIFRPTRVSWWIVGLGLLGALGAAARPHQRAGLLLFLVVYALVVASVSLVGEVPRYRYPIDPLTYTLAAAGLSTLTTLVLAGWRRLRVQPALLSRQQSQGMGGTQSTQPASQRR